MPVRSVIKELDRVTPARDRTAGKIGGRDHRVNRALIFGRVIDAFPKAGYRDYSNRVLKFRGVNKSKDRVESIAVLKWVQECAVSGGESSHGTDQQDQYHAGAFN